MILIIKADKLIEKMGDALEDRGKNRAMLNGGGLVGAVIAFILAMYILDATFSPLETAATNLNQSLGASNLSGVSNLATLPDTSVLIFMLVVLFGLILMAVRGSDI